MCTAAKSSIKVHFVFFFEAHPNFQICEPHRLHDTSRHIMWSSYVAIIQIGKWLSALGILHEIMWETREEIYL